MKKFICIVLLVALMVSGTASAVSVDGDFGDNVYNLVTSFCGDAKTTRGFAWSAETEYNNMVIQYAKADEWETKKEIVSPRYTEYNGRLFYKAELTNLQPGTTYTYRIGVVQDDTWSGAFNFTTEANDVTEFSFIGVTDPQSSSWSSGFNVYKDTLDKAIEDAPDAAFMVNVGDLVGTGTLQSQWDDYFKATKGLVERLPHMAVVGNHEVYYPSGETVDVTDIGKLFSLQFNHPDNGRYALGSLTVDDVTKDHNKGVITNVEDTIYSFDYGNAHFVVLNTGSDQSSTDHKTLLKEQIKWLKADLGATDKKWKIVLSHIGIYPAKTERWHARDLMLPVYQECGVDLVLNGHDHMVARTKDELGLGTTFTILGSAGTKRYDPVEEQAEYLEVLHNTDADKPVYFVFDVNEERIKLVAKQSDGKVLDEYILTGIDEISTETEENLVTINKFVMGGSDISVLVTYPDVEEITSGNDICYIGEAYMEQTGMYSLVFKDGNKGAGEYKIRMNVHGEILENGFRHQPRMYMMDMNSEIKNLSEITGKELEAKLEIINIENGRFFCAQYKGQTLVDVDYVDVEKGDGDSMTIEYNGSAGVDRIKLFFWDKTSMEPELKEVIIY